MNSIHAILAIILIVSLAAFLVAFSHHLRYPTKQEAYESGRKTAKRAIEKSSTPNEVADHLYLLSDGEFSTQEFERAFDRGIQDQLKEMGY